MNIEWKQFECDLQELKVRIASMREKFDGLAAADTEQILAPLRGCMVEMIALRSSLEKLKSARS